MQNPSKNPRGQIVAAVSFDSQTEAVLRTSVSLARRFDMSLHFVSVVEATFLNPWIQVSASEMAYYPIYPEVDEAERRNKLARIEELARRVESAYPVTTSVTFGLKTPTIVAEAVAKRANLIVTGFNPDSYKLNLTGMSTPLSLLAEAPMPVLAVCEGATPDFAKKPFKILVADDFSETTKEAVLKGFELAAGLEAAEVRQTYVHGDFRELIRSRWEEFKCRLPDKDSATLTPDSLWENEYQALLAKGKEQGSPFRRKAELKGVKVSLDVRTGRDVGQEFNDVVDEFQPDLVAFGRHRLLRARPFLIGRMPAQTMLQLKKPILVVPPASELYTRLPFPAAT